MQQCKLLAQHSSTQLAVGGLACTTWSAAQLRGSIQRGALAEAPPCRQDELLHKLQWQLLPMLGTCQHRTGPSSLQPHPLADLGLPAGQSKRVSSAPSKCSTTKLPHYFRPQQCKHCHGIAYTAWHAHGMHSCSPQVQQSHTFLGMHMTAAGRLYK